jgi:hypothetical protein
MNVRSRLATFRRAGLIGVRRHALIACATIASLAMAGFLASQFLSRPEARSNEPTCGRATNDARHYDSKPAECVWSAFSSGRKADAVITSITVEGDPIRYGVNVKPPSVAVDIWSQDRFGLSGHFRYSCSGLTHGAATNSASPAYIFLVATGCTGPRGYVDEGRVIIP